jgi:hypothetical protein
MELLLNLLWCAIAAGLTGFLICHQRTRAFRPHWGLMLAATLFIVVLLFPAISASDDLYHEMFLSEDASRRGMSAISTHLDHVQAIAVFSSIPLGLSSGGLRYCGQMVETGSLLALPCSSRVPFGLRAPPADLSL